MVKDNQYQQKHNFKCLQFLFFFSFFRKYIQFLTGDFWNPPREEKVPLHKVSWQQLLFKKISFNSYSPVLGIYYTAWQPLCVLPFPFHFSKQSDSILPWICITKSLGTEWNYVGWRWVWTARKHQQEKLRFLFIAKAGGKSWSIGRLKTDSIPYLIQNFAQIVPSQKSLLRSLYLKLPHLILSGPSILFTAFPKVLWLVVQNSHSTHLLTIIYLY